MTVKILVADDSVTMRRILELTFAGEDAQVSVVDSGDAAVSRAAELRPDVVLADASMSMDGYRVASAIKSSPATSGTAVIVLASQKAPYDEAKGKAAGVDDHVLKPFDTQLVIDKVKQVMGRPRTALGSPGAGAKPPAPPAPPAAPQDGMRASRTGTIAFGKAPATAAGMAAPVPPPSPQMSASPRAAAASPASSRGGDDLSAKLDGMGLTPEQVAGVLALTRDVVERVVWEVVPELAETLIKEEIRRLTR